MKNAMKQQHHAVFALVAVVTFAATLFAKRTGSQPAAPGQAAANPRGRMPALVRSPEVNPDRTVTFRLRAPQATAVELVGEILQGKPPVEMTKDADGVWSVTIGPLPPEIWLYDFRISRPTICPRPGNINVTPRSPDWLPSRRSKLQATLRRFTTRARCRMARCI